MGKATGVFLILAGVGTAALVLPAVDKESERQLADVIRIATGSSSTAQQATTPPSHVPLVAVQTKTEAVKPIVVAKVGAEIPAQPARSTLSLQAMPTPPGATTNAAPVAIAAAAPVKSDGPAPVLIAPPQLTTRNANAAPARPDDDQAKQNLARDIQRELKRVGCYDGDLSGDWNTATRRAMKQFIEKVNAALPSDAPDHILRTMVQGHPGNACGKSGTVTAALMKPSAKVADKSAEPGTREVSQIAAARPVVPKPAWETTVAAAPAKPLSIEGRMAIGGPDPLAAAPSITVVPEPKLVAREPVAAVASVAAPAPSNVTEKSAARIITPGAIAALSQPRPDRVDNAAVAPRPSAGPAAIEPAPAVLIAPPKRVEAKVEPKTERERETRGVRDARADDQEAARRERQRQAARRSPPPEVFKYPSYLGATAPKYFATQTSGVKSNFTSRFFEIQRRDGSQR
jgi:Putative peptidoglycan binding domain